MSSFRDLCLIKAKIEPCIRENLEGSSLDIKLITSGTSYKFRFPNNHPPTATLNVLDLNGGKVTLFYGQGKNPVFSEKIAKKIIEVCSYAKLPFNQLALGKIDDTDFEYFILFVQDYAEIESEVDLPNGKQYKCKGKQGDIISINRYNNKTLHIQGSPSLLLRN